LLNSQMTSNRRENPTNPVNCHEVNDKRCRLGL
jgi:hypothetical protein